MSFARSLLIFLEYQEFSTCIDDFFDKLYDEVIVLSPLSSKKYIINLFKFAPYKMENKKIKKIPKDIKIEYNNLENSNPIKNLELVQKINEIKIFYNQKYIFLYNKLRDNYGAKLQQENKIFLCPYCQRNYVNIIQESDLTIKPDLDHFYPKGKYPFLAVTLENLVPSCQVCNSRLKGEIDFYINEHSHPLQASGNIFKKIEFNYLNDKTIFIDKKYKLSINEKRTINTFKLEEVYNSHTKILDEILEKNKKYNYVKKNHILKTCPSMGMRMIKELVFHEYINIDDRKVPMCSLKKSLFEKIVK